MDKYKLLRQIQKKERNNATLARVDETFYSEIHEYIDELKQRAIDDPFSNVPQILHEAQRIATEICQRREHKITDAAVVNIHRSYHLFTGKPQFDLVDTTPLNLTPEEEKFYFSLIDTLKNHRQNISLEKFSDEDESATTQIIKPKVTQSNKLIDQKPVEKVDFEEDSLEGIVKTKPIIDKKPSEKPSAKPQKIVQKGDVKAKPKTNEASSIEENPNAFDETEEFYDFESKKIAKDTELVTMLVFDEVGSIVGVDEKIYGPFMPQDLVTLPLINAKVFFKNRKGRQVKI